MDKARETVNVVGGGVFGLSSAQELQRRGFRVSVFDSGLPPDPLAASTDISKAVRMDYGSDEFYMRLMEQAFKGWDEWNHQWGRKLFHDDGILFLSRNEMEPGGFEFESFRLLEDRGYQPVRATDAAFRERFKVWNPALYPDGYYNPRGGWAESENVVSALLQDANSAGIQLYHGVRIADFLERGSRVIGIRGQDGGEYLADFTIVAAGTWTPKLLPELQDVMGSVAQPVFHFQVPAPARFQAPNFVPWGADISKTGWYGFPALENGTLKIANHGRGWQMDPDGSRAIPDGVEQEFREFIEVTFPELADAPVIGTRMCFYCDTWDGDFWIDRHPSRPGLVVVAGGSGHGFKFAPQIGVMVADLLRDRSNPFLHRFAWRERGTMKTEEARFA